MAFARLFPIDAIDAQDDERTSSELGPRTHQRRSPSNVPVTSLHFGPLRIRYAIRHILEGRLGVRVRHAVRFPLRHILCNRLTCSLMCSCRNPSAATFLYMCQTISWNSARSRPFALGFHIGAPERLNNSGC